MRNLGEVTVRRPIVSSVLCLVSGVVVVLLSLMIPFNSFLFLPSMISGVIVLIGGILLYMKPTSHALWSILVIVVAVVDLLGALYFLYSPVAQALLPTLVASVGPLLALVGGVIGLAWKPIGTRASNQSLNA